MTPGSKSCRAAKWILVAAASVCFVASCLNQSARVPPTITASETPDPIPLKVSDKKFEAFNHAIDEHKQFECRSCHQREGRSLDMEYAGHDSCIGCHLNQFTDKTIVERDKAMCAICHGDLQSNPPTMKAFPARFNEGWNMKFDHADHDSGAGRPPAGCASCHQSAGAAKSIPVGFQAHNNCYSCHTAESPIGSCNTCHELASYRRTSPARTAFRGAFSHNQHTSVGCADCHSVRTGQPQGRQVSTIAVSQHCGGPNNCATCHNGARAFGDGNLADIASCARCHTASFDMLAGDPCR